jgi:hypothetical protein
MAFSPLLAANSPEIKDLVYVKTNIGGWFFDAFLNLEHISRLRITEHPVQTGANISDHSFLEPKELNIEVGMSDAATSLVSNQFVGSWSRSVKAYEILRELQAQRIPMQVLTRLGLYRNMMIETLSVPDNYKTLYGLRATVAMREVLVAETRVVRVSSRPQITNSTNRGNVEPVEDKSLLYQSRENYQKYGNPFGF